MGTGTGRVRGSKVTVSRLGTEMGEARNIWRNNDHTVGKKTEHRENRTTGASRKSLRAGGGSWGPLVWEGA